MEPITLALLGFGLISAVGLSTLGIGAGLLAFGLITFEIGVAVLGTGGSLVAASTAGFATIRICFKTKFKSKDGKEKVKTKVNYLPSVGN